MPDPDYNLTTLEEVKNDLELTSADTYDDILEALIGAVSEWIEDVYCNRKFVSREYTEVMDGKGKDTVFLKNRPIVEVKTVHDDLDGDFNSDSLIDDDCYRAYTKEGKVRLIKDTIILQPYTVFQDGVNNVQVVYTAGYETVPKAVNLACRKMVIKLFKSKDDKERIKSETIGQYSVTYDNQDVPADIKLLLDGYVNVNI